MQTLGSWFKIPILAIAIQAVIFSLGHGYNSFGLFETLVVGLICGFFAWKSNGIEKSCAFHTANNFSVGFLIMLGIQTSGSSHTLFSVLCTIFFEIILCAVMYYAAMKTDWFGEIPENT